MPSFRLKSKPGILAWLLFLFALHLYANGAESWTVLVYIASDNNLSDAAIQNINDMEAAALPANLKLIVQSDLPEDSPYPGGQRRLIRADSSPEITSPLLQNLGPIDSGNPRTLYDFASWGFKRYPSQRKALIIWGHGNNWFKEQGTKWICPDEGAQSLIGVSNGQFKAALQGLPHLDILILDACSMQSVEVLTEIKSVADYVIGSEDEVPYLGFPYRQMVALFDGTRAPEAICSQIVDEYIASYDLYGSQNPTQYPYPVTCSAIRMQAFDAFLRELQRFSLKYRYRAGELLALRAGCHEMNHGYCDVDIYEYFGKVSTGTSDAELQNAALAVRAAWEEAIVHKSNLTFAAEVGGAALWFPWDWQYFEAFWSHYYKLDFTQYRWISLLSHAYGWGEYVPLQPPTLLSTSHSLGSVVAKLSLEAYPDDTALKAIVEYENETLTYQYDLAWMQEQVYIRIPLKSDACVKIVRLGHMGYDSSALELELQAPEVALSLQAHPNPVRNRAGAVLRWYVPEGLSGSGKLELFNLKGQMLGSYKLGDVAELEGCLPFPSWPLLNNVPSGVYQIRLKVGRKSCKEKLTML